MVIAVIIIGFYLNFIKRSASKKLFNGIFSIIALFIFSKILIMLNLLILGRFLEGISTILLFSLVVIFQPELRKFLGYLGQHSFIHKTLFSMPKTSNPNVNFTKELFESVKYLSKSKIGALIVIQDDENMTGYSEVGTRLNAAISSELILTIFHPNTALHDGALIMTKNKILAAGVLLPLTDDPELSWQYGTRHRAAIGITEITDAVCIVVSEETGHVSLVESGRIKKIDSLELFTLELQKISNEFDAQGKKGFSFKKKVS
ncbi:MAG: diadenylate cyclase CdaA [Candidatus Gastranaerophilales bacterium]|nr:diadenylate cyclase CdaA [Candidatus Gastranaerophilales bacterium]